MAAVQPRGLFGGDEELRPVGVFARVGHGQPAGAVVLELEVLVGELLAIDTTTARAVAFGEIASLDHEILNDPVEFTALVPFALGPLGQLDEVLRGFRYGCAEQADFHAFRFVRAQTDVKPHLLNVGRGSKGRSERRQSKNTAIR